MNKQTKVGKQETKTVTRYDQKLEKRRLQQEQNARKERLFNLSFLAIAIVIAGVVIVGFGLSFVNKHKALNNTYIKVGDHELTKLEYDYYYNMTKNNYLTNYASILPYMGLDTNTDFAKQQYTETMTWKDAFDQMAVSQVTQTKSIVDDAKANSFSPDLTEAYNEFETNIALYAQYGGANEAQYFKASFGPYATKANVEPFVKENLLVEAYYEYLLEQNAPTEDEITTYYEANKNNYDKVSYRSFTFNADIPEDATEEQITAAMADTKLKAEEMKSRRESGGDFRELCLEYATDDNKTAYEDAENDQSLTEGAAYLSTSSYYQDWLFDESRKADDITVAEDTVSNRYYVVEFIERAYDETTNESISDTLASGTVSEYIAALAEKYEVTDVAGDMVYLTVEETTAAAETSAEAAAEDDGEVADTSADTTAESTSAP